VPATDAGTTATTVPVSSPSTSAATTTGGTGAPSLASTGAGNYFPVLLVAGLCLVAIGMLGRRLLLALVHRAKRTQD